MDKDHNHDRALLIIISCFYVVMMAFWVSAYNQPEISAADAETELAAMPVDNGLSETSDTREAAGPEEIQMVDWISVRGKTAETVFHPIIEEAAQQYDVEPELIKAIIWAESSFNPNAVSRKGAVGLMQVMPSTARALGVENLSDPESNIIVGVRYFKQLMEKFDDDAELAVAAYNAGSRKVLKYKGVPPFETTQFYVKKVFEYYNDFKGGADTDINRT